MGNAEEERPVAAKHWTFARLVRMLPRLILAWGAFETGVGLIKVMGATGGESIDPARELPYQHLKGSRWLADLEQLLAAETRSLLMAAASGIPVEPERMRPFARACLEVSEVGRLALAVLDGGVFAPRRVLELAKLVNDAVATTPAEHTAVHGAGRHD